MKKIITKKIPYICKNVPPESVANLSKDIKSEEGAIILVQALSHKGRKNDFDYVSTRQGWLWENDIIPAVLGYRKAATEFAGAVPEKLKAGDELFLLCESGLVGDIQGIFPSWGNPMKVKVLGAIADQNKKLLNINMFKSPNMKKSGSNYKKIPLIVFLSTIMDAGKTTMACKVTHELTKMGKKVSAIKLTGVAYSQDLAKLSDAGAISTYDFVDMGLPSTCNGDPQKVVESALNLVNLAKQDNPDCIVVELGDGVIGEYHVKDILQNNDFVSQISLVILAAKDFAGIKGTKDTLEDWEIPVNLVTGPIANSEVGTLLIDKYFGIPAESNLGYIPKTIELIKEKLSKTENKKPAIKKHFAGEGGELYKTFL